MAEPLIRNISDTARWVATYRARETERPDALFRDPLAARLAGERGERIVEAAPNVAGSDRPFIVRTVLFDRMIADEVTRGLGAVVNLAAGLDTRPYRMTLPASLRWVEVDLPEILQYKSELLRLPFMLRLMSLLPQPRGPNRIWSGVCRLQRKR